MVSQDGENLIGYSDRGVRKGNLIGESVRGVRKESQ